MIHPPAQSQTPSGYDPTKWIKDWMETVPTGGLSRGQLDMYRQSNRPSPNPNFDTFYGYITDLYNRRDNPGSVQTSRQSGPLYSGMDNFLEQRRANNPTTPQGPGSGVPPGAIDRRLRRFTNTPPNQAYYENG